MGLTTEPLPERMAAAGWAPDAFTAYCQRCGSTTGPHDADDTGCSTCRGRSIPWERMVRLGPFEGLLRELVHEVKFTRWRRLGDDLGRLLAGAISEAAGAAGFNPAQFVLIPVPSSFQRRMARGIDHSLVIARGAAKALDCELVRALHRRHRPSQTSLPPSQRATNIAGAFRFRVGCTGRVQGRLAIVLDDVTTTRATLRAACRELERGLRLTGAKAEDGPTRIWSAVLAVTPDRNEKRPTRERGVAASEAAERSGEGPRD
jgi:predicted amidophosphoribosyltransferase